MKDTDGCFLSLKNHDVNKVLMTLKYSSKIIVIIIACILPLAKQNIAFSFYDNGEKLGHDSSGHISSCLWN